ncbi:probable LRR receptor-like serine/threonine-protein kinase At5g48740 isoform X2 [Andrographis paniculata]|uniref:probable LRR receptor-like serine/threonine-protein kinase At5g48740 isoform X2 n=1 Tax=Andrographis paniculata TaxID=175694 RepID=UPI0021E7FA02|nr:probable LRR receptor-like serine/threonine-protein kinase At5g48740 isoform X2 [Andrographis paniculata]
MELRHFDCFLLFLLPAFIAHALSYQDGFLSLTCGGATSYIDSSNISWTPDGDYVTSGNTTSVVFPEGSSSTTLPVRFFPDSVARMCYRLPLQNSSSLVLVRAQFVYKNYDQLGKPPVFSVSLGTAMSATVNLAHTDPWIEEFIFPANKEFLPLCFYSIPNGGVPVISSLELRPIPPGAYRSALGSSTDKLLRKSYRINCGYNDGSLRYPLDPYDRIWSADEDFSPYHVSSGFDIQSNFSLSNIKEAPPTAVLQSGRVLARRNSLVYNLPLDNQGDYHVVLYFAGILPVSPAFDILINGDVVQSNYTVMQWEANSLFFTLKGIRTLNITLKAISYYPLVNALEVYEIVDIPLESSSTAALQVIQQSTGLDLGWQDDPCSPTPWEHVGCDGNLVTSLKLFDINLRTINPTFGDLLDLKELDLHNTSLAGEIQNLGGLQHLEKLNLSFNKITSLGSELEDLTNIEVLDLQNNSLHGTVPESWGELKDLHFLNLENNNLQGPLPQTLNRESVEVRTSGNLCLSFSLTCTELSTTPSLENPQVTIFAPRKRNNHRHLAVLLGAVGGAVLALFVVSFSVLLYMKRKKSENTFGSKPGLDMSGWDSARFFTYKEIKSTTNNFKEAIGRGSFGCVYTGKLPGGKPVAVKVRFDKSQLGADSFINEVSFLSQIHHQNLVTLEGFCCESKQQILIYEYLPGGSLADNLYGANSKKLTLSWVRRLKIAVDAAKGLEYLHNGSDLRIIHRDVKSSNILLDKEMNAKVCDFGLSKQVTQADASHVTTIVKGTAGYLDPEYYSTQQLTEKSDVYSFGVVLLELICGREPLTHTGSPDSFNLVLWAKPYLQAGAFEIVDESIKGTYDGESMRRASLIACRSVERDAQRRPSISEVLAELKEAYSLQLSYLASSGSAN